MKNRIQLLILGLAGLTAFASCNVGIEDFPQPSKHTVYFTANENSPVTKTGITIDNSIVTPDWRLTKAQNVSLFEYQADNIVTVGEDVEIAIAADNLTATFKADFPENMTIIVDPTNPEIDPSGAKRGRGEAGYTYAAVIAQQGESKDPTFVVPATQYPDPDALIDPDADFLIGYSKTAVLEPHNYDENVVDLYFDRPVSLGRLSLTNFAGSDESVKTVTIVAQGGMSGSASLSDIDFEKASVTFTADTDGGITLSYGKTGQAVSEGAFVAYFVSLPGDVTITAIEVVTDQYRYTKTIEGGKLFSFSNEQFKSINMNLSTAVCEAIAAENVTWYKASVLEDGIDYLIVSSSQALKNDGGTTAAFSVTDDNGVITFEDEVDPAIVWTATAHEEMTGDNGSGGVVAGHFTLTNDGYYLRRNSSEILLDTTIPSDKPKYVVWDYDGTYLRHESSESMTFYCYYDSEWKTGNTQNGDAPGSSIGTVQLYTTRLPQELSFSPATSAEYDLATSEWTVAVPTLSGAQTAVTYALSENSNPAVATVDADGTVHPLSRGTVTIVATAAGNAQYQAASATYTLKVVDSSVTTNTYIKVTSTSDLSIGDKYLMVYEGGKKVFNPILDGNVFSKDEANALDAEITDNTIVSDSFEDSHLTLVSGYFLKVDKYSEYLYPSSASNRGILSAESTASNALNITIGNNGIASIITKTGTYYLVWSTSSDYFSASTDIEGSYSTGICLYKLDDGRLPQELSFSHAEVNYDLAGSDALVKPILSDAIGTVTYSSSDETIASVDPDSGDVTVKKKGTVAIIAYASGDSQYKSGSASYTLVITDSSITTPVWYKAEEIEDGETYLIVSNGYALKNDGSSAGAAIDLGVSGDSFEYEAEEDMIWTATASSSKFRLGNGGKVLRLSNSSFQIGSASGTESNNQWNLSEDALLMISSNYLYYSTSQSKWSLSTSASSTHTAYLYGLHPGRQSQTLSFSATSIEYDIAGSTAFTAPTLSGAETDVTYSSNKPAVATVDAESGEVEIVGTGTVVITASAEGTDTFKPATASYTIHVIDSNNPVTEDTYVKVTSASDLVAGEKYILVYEDGAKVFKPTLNGSNFTTTGNALDVTISNETIVSNEFEECQMTLESGYYFYVASVSMYLYPTYNNMGAEESKSSSHSFGISISDGIATISRTSGNNTYKLLYSSSSYFQSSTSDANVALYKLTN